MKNKIVIINGTGGSGKDTFVEYCKEHMTVFNHSSVDIIKQAASIIGWDGKKDDKSRKFLSDLKALVTEYNDGCFKYMKEMVETFTNVETDDCILFLHIREPEEIKRVVDEFGAITLLITNSNVEDITTNESDRRVYEYKYDYIVDNSGSLQDLAEKAYEFICSLKVLDVVE